MGKAGAARVKAGNVAYASAMQDHEERLDVAGTLRSKENIQPLVYSPYANAEAPNPFNETVKKREPDKIARQKPILDLIEVKPVDREFTIMQACNAHTKGARKSKGASKDLLHAFLQFPTDIKISDGNQRVMLAVAVDFINETYGGNAVFHARVDRDEVGQHGVDVFFAPRYEKHTKSKGTEQWISLSKFSKENARIRYGQRQKTVKNKETGKFDLVFDEDNQRVMVWNDANVFQGRALQDSWFEHLKANAGKKYQVERGKRKKSIGPDRQSPEDYALQQEQEKFQAELKRQLEPATSEDAADSAYREPIATMLSDARDEVAEIVLRARESAEADVRAITRSMLNKDGKEFMETKEENRLLHQTVKRQSAMIQILQDTLKRLVPDGLRKKVRDAYDKVWASAPENSGKTKGYSSKGYTDDGYSR